jgi:carboxypeptidase Q
VQEEDMRERSARPFALFIGCVLLLGATTVAQVTAGVDPDAISRIRAEASDRSQVMDVLSYLTDVYGPRLTGSPNLKNAATYAVRKMMDWGIANARLEPWGPFGKGWSNERFAARVTAPQSFALIGYPKAWTPGTQGSLTGEAVLATIESDADLETWRGKLRGKFVLITPLRNVRAAFDAPGRRFTDQDLDTLAKPPQPRPAGNPQTPQQPARSPDFPRRRLQFFVDEGVAAVVEGGRGDGGTVFVQAGNMRQFADMQVPTQVVLAIEHYGRVARTLQKQIPVSLEMNVENKFYEDDLNSFTVVGEIPGTDKADELVMVGAHLDSWHAGTGATDNAVGSAVMLEVMRVLKATGLKMRRTVRIGLWTGEEQGLLGSRAYVAQHFANRSTMELKPEHAKVSAYYNLDNGTGTIRGIYLQGNTSIAPIFQEWMRPFTSLGMTTLSVRNTGGTDHTSFDAVGIPGFQFVQDPIEYETRTHHSNMDVFERVQEQDLIQNAGIIATFVYQTANRDESLPRKPLPAAPSSR